MGKKSKAQAAKQGEQAGDRPARPAAEESRPAGCHFAPCDRPTPRCHFTLTEVEPGRLLLFGGEVFNGRKFICFQEVYELCIPQSAKLTWRKLELGGSEAPTARSSHQALAWHGGLWIFGGEWADATQDTIKQFKDVWCLTCPTGDAGQPCWTQMPADKGFSQRSGHRVCLHDGAAVIFGGYRDDASGDPAYLADVHRFDLAQRKFKKSADLSGAAPRARSACQLWSDGKAVWLYGGATPAPKKKGVKEHMDALTDLWRLDAGSWSGPMSLDGPGPRNGLASAPMAGESPNLRLFFGGVTDRFGLKKDEYSAFHNDAWMLDTKALSWTRLDLSPGSLQGRISTQLTAVAAPGRAELFLLFGGMAEAGPREITMDDLWCLCHDRDGASAGPPPMRWSCLMPLSSKTKTWFPDNDGDSSDEEAARPSASGQSSGKGQPRGPAAPAAPAGEPSRGGDVEMDAAEAAAAKKAKKKAKKAAKKGAKDDSLDAADGSDGEEADAPDAAEPVKEAKSKAAKKAGKKGKKGEEPEPPAPRGEDRVERGDKGSQPPPAGRRREEAESQSSSEGDDCGAAAPAAKAKFAPPARGAGGFGALADESD